MTTQPRESAADPYTNIVMGSLTFRNVPQKGQTSLEKLLEPDIFRLETSLSVEEGKNAVMSFAKSGHCRLRVKGGWVRARLPVLERVGAVEPDQVGIGQPQYLSSHEARWQMNEGCGCVQVLISSKHRWDDLKTPTAKLEQIGFANLGQAIWHHVLNPGQEYPESPTLGQFSGVYVTLPGYHARISKAVVQGHSVSVSVQVLRGISLSDFRLVVRAYGASKDTGWSVFFVPAISDPLRRRTTTFRFETAPHHAYAKLYWRHGGSDEEVAFVDSANAGRAEAVVYPQLAAHSLFDPNLQAVERALASDDSKGFEWAIATLLAVIGFQVDWIGFAGGRLKREADILAYLPSHQLAIAGECTLKWGDIGKKLSSLKEEISRLKPVLEGWRIRGVVFTNLSKEALLPADRDGAQSFEIALLPKEGLSILVQAVKSAIPPDLLWARLQGEGMSLAL